MKFVCEPKANYIAGLKESIVFQGDAEQLLNQLPSKFFRCCVTSPPYWGLRDYASERQIGAENEPSEYISRLVAVFKEVRRVLTDDGTLWLNIHEYVFLFSKSLKYYYDYESIQEPSGRNRRTVWSIPTEPFPGAHFATFPPKLVEPCIIAGFRPGDWILDPFFGAGTVGIVGEQQHRKYVGIELNREYVTLAVNRIRNTERLLFTYDKERK